MRIYYDVKGDYRIQFYRTKPLTKLLVLDANHNVAHNGVKETLNNLRQQYWIPKIRNFIKKLIYDCRLCQCFNGQPYCYPPMLPLPSSRVT